MEPGFSRSDSPAEPAGNLRTTAAAGSTQGNHAGSGRGNPRTGDRDGQCPSFLLSNITRLIKPFGHNKVGFLFDQALRNNALFVGVTETCYTQVFLMQKLPMAFLGTAYIALTEQVVDRVVE